MKRPFRTDHLRKIKNSNSSVSWITEWELYAKRLEIYTDHLELRIKENEMTIKRLNRPK